MRRNEQLYAAMRRGCTPRNDQLYAQQRIVSQFYPGCQEVNQVLVQSPKWALYNSVDDKNDRVTMFYISPPVYFS